MARREMGERWTEEQARTVLHAWEQSGQSGAAYARSVGVVAQRLYWWRRRLLTNGAAMTTLVPVAVRGATQASPSVVVTTPPGVRIEVHDVDSATAGWVRAVLRGEEPA